MNCKNVTITSNYIEKKFNNYKIILCSDSFSKQNCKIEFTISELVPGNQYDFIFGIGAFSTVDPNTGSYPRNDYFEVYLDKSYKFSRKETGKEILIDYNNNEIIGKSYTTVLPGQTYTDWKSAIWENVKISFIAPSETINGYFYLKTDENYKNEAWGIIKDSYQVCGNFIDNSKKYYFIDEIPYGQADYQIFTSEIHFSDNEFEYGDLYFCIKNPTTVTFNNYIRTINEEGIYKIENIKLLSNNYINIGNNKGIIVKYHDTYISNYQIPEKYICDILDDKSCIAYYPFKEDANDKCGKYDGKIYGKIIFNNEAIFDGKSYIDITNVNNILNNKKFAISFFVKKNEIPEKAEAILSIGDEQGRNVLIIGFNEIFHYLESQNIKFNSELNKYNFYVLNFDNNKITFYLNNKLITKNKDFGVIFKPNQKIYIGADKKDNGTPQLFFKGSIKNLRFFNKNLTDIEIQKLYNLKK